MKKLSLLLLLVVSLNAIGSNDIYPFRSDVKRETFQSLTEELRCLVCQNQSLADSNASLAVDLRREIYKKVKEGESRQRVIDYMVNRYGEFVLFKPRLSSLTSVLWLGPFILLLVVLIAVFFWIKRRRKNI